MTSRAKRIADPTVCDECGHPVELHRSTGCLWLLVHSEGCRCPLDLR